MRRKRIPSTEQVGQTELCVVCSQGHLLGKIDGKLEEVLKNQEDHKNKMEAMDGRLRSVENRSAIAGAVGGLMVALGLDLLKSKLFKG